MSGIAKTTYTFLKQLEKNNNRIWFAEHKAQFEQTKIDFESFVNTIKSEIEKHDEIESSKIYRIYRDVRFSKNKTPYKNALSGHFTRATKWKRGGYYLHLQPNNQSYVGGGFWMPNKEDLFRIRKEIEINDKPFRKVFNSASFKKTFGNIQGEQLKTAPRGFNKEHPAVDLLRYKSFVCTHKFSDADLMDSKAAKSVATTFKKMHPFFDLFSEVLTTNLNGEAI